MSVLTATDCFRPGPGGLRGWLADRGMAAALAAAPFVLGVLRRWAPIAGFGSVRVVTRYDDVLEVFAADHAFGVPYADNLAVITGDPPFFLGMGDTRAYREQVAAMRAVMRPGDLSRLGDEAERRGRAELAAMSDAGQPADVVALVRRVSFGLLGDYLGVPEPKLGSLAVWGTRLFVFQFTGSPSDAAWRAEVEEIAAAFRAHVDEAIRARKAARGRTDDVLERCLALQDDGHPGFTDPEIRTALLCMVVGGPPQPPMVVPQAVEQLLRRPEWLVEARSAARRGDDAALHDILFEAMRFDPLAPGLPRRALEDHTVASGTPRARTIPKGATVIAAFASAMMDERRVPDPASFDPHRLPHEYVHFGHGLHECFGRHINHATLHRMVKPLLAAEGLARAPGPSGHLRKRGPFADRLEVVWREATA